MDLPDPIVVLKGTLPPIGAGLLLVSLGGARLTAAAAAIGCYLAFGLLKSWPALPHELWSAPDGREWLVWSVVFVACASTLERLRWLPAKLGPGLAVVLAAACVWLMTRKLAQRWDTANVLLHVGGGGVLVALLALACRKALARAPATIAPAVVFSTVLSIDAVLLTIAASGLLGQLCGAVAAALGAAAGTALWRRSFALTAADGTWLGIAHGLFVLLGAHLAELLWPAALAALAAPSALLLLGNGTQQRPVRWTLLALLLTSLPLGFAIWWQLTRR